MRSRILFLPECPDRDAFVDVLARTAFHLAYLEPETLTFVVAPGLRQSAERVVQDTIVPDGFDAVTEEHIRRVSGRVVIVETGTPEAERLGDDSDIIAVWDSVRFAEGPWAYEAGRRDPFRTIFNVDPRTNRLEASEYAMLGHKVAAPPVGAEESRFHTMLRDLGPAGDVYLFGTGPSIAEAADRPFESGVRIVANTVILDRDLMAHIQPQIVTYADPIFHFGPSRYAARFRSELRRALAGDPGLRTIIPFRYRAFLADLMPEHADRIIGVPQLGASAPLVLDLTEQFGVKSFPNILTMLMIPLAATVGHRIGLIGFDGRQPGESYFWKHGAKVQLHDELPAIRKIHPGFFVVDYEDYYATHLTTVEHLFQSCEAAGIVVQSLSGSFMPPLRRRAATARETEWVVPVAVTSRLEEVFVSVDPDWIDDFGHHGPWFAALATEFKQIDIPAVSLASRGIDATGRPEVRPTFSYPTVNPRAASSYAPSFEAELNESVAQLVEEAPDADLVLAFYTADVWHLPALIRVAARHPGRVRAAVNLMRSHRDIVDFVAAPTEELNWWGRALRGLIELGGTVGVTVTVDTEELARLLTDSLDIKVDVWPMGTASVVRVVETEPSDRILFYCPAQSQESKGVIEYAHAAASMLADDWADRTRFAMRSIDQPARTGARVVEAIDHAAAAGVEILDGALSDEQYAAAIEEADVVVVPYHIDPFRTRTSSVVIDAMRAGKPVVVAAGTWAAEVADSIGSAVLFRSGDAADLARSMGEAANRLPALTMRALTNAEQVNEEYSMGQLVEFLRRIPRAESATDPAAVIDRSTEIESALQANRHGTTKGRAAARTRIVELSHRLRDKDEALNKTIDNRDRRYETLNKTIEDRDRRSEREAAKVLLLEEQVKNLERGFGNRVFAAIKRRLTRS